jgi:hypothetical protein
MYRRSVALSFYTSADVFSRRTGSSSVIFVGKPQGQIYFFGAPGCFSAAAGSAGRVLQDWVEIVAA